MRLTCSFIHFFFLFCPHSKKIQPELDPHLPSQLSHVHHLQQLRTHIIGLQGCVPIHERDFLEPLQDRKNDEVADPKLNCNYVEDELKRVVLVALICANNRPEKRPTMLEVVELLKRDSKVKLAELENDELFKAPQAVDYNDGASAVEDSSDFISEEKDSKQELKEEIKHRNELNY
jgi:hypothetical protein